MTQHGLYTRARCMTGHEYYIEHNRILRIMHTPIILLYSYSIRLQMVHFFPPSFQISACQFYIMHDTTVVSYLGLLLEIHDARYIACTIFFNF